MRQVQPRVHFAAADVPQKDFSNKAVLVMLVVVIVITLGSLILYLNVLNHVSSSIQTSPVPAPQAVSSRPSSNGVVGLTILPRQNSSEGNP